MADIFAEHVRLLNRRGKRFIDMQIGSLESRSTTWWNKVANNQTVSPPTQDVLGPIAMMMGVSKRRVEEMIAEQWYGVRPGDGISPRVRHLAAAIDELDDEDTELVEQLIHRLRRRSGEATGASEAA